MGALWTEVRMTQNQFPAALCGCLTTLIAYSSRQAAAYLIWYMQTETFQVLIKRRPKWPTVELFWSSRQWGVQTMWSQWDWYLWTKRLSRSICQHLSLSFLWSSLSVSQHLDTFGMKGRRGETRALFHPSHPTDPQGARGWFVILCLTW